MYIKINTHVLGGFQNKDINKNMCQNRLDSKERPLQSHAQMFEDMCIHTSDQVAECQFSLKAEGRGKSPRN